MLYIEQITDSKLQKYNKMSINTIYWPGCYNTKWRWPSTEGVEFNATVGTSIIIWPFLVIQYF